MTKRVCDFEGCSRPHNAKGLCGAHYQQAARGDELTELAGRFPRVDNLSQFFWDRVVKTPTCWNWTGAKTTLGYGQIKFRGPFMFAHRYSYEQAVGEIRPGGVIDHLCHNSSCVNPDHLRVASHTQNMQNRSGAHSNSKSGVRGVFWSKSHKKWRVIVASGGVKHHGGFFSNIEDAGTAAEELRRLLHS